MLNIIALIINTGLLLVGLFTIIHGSLALSKGDWNEATAYMTSTLVYLLLLRDGDRK